MNNIIITGAAGFIGSCLIQQSHEKSYKNIIAVDDFSNAKKNKNLDNKPYISKIERDKLFSWLESSAQKIDFILHIGARTDTTETNWDIFQTLNLDYSQQIWNYCVKQEIPLIYASSAATYGIGELGYEDNHSIVEQLKPLNLYGVSKNDFDKWALKQEKTPPFWAGLKFFNVYGPNEYHKNRMASVIFHSFHQLCENGYVKLFRSHHPGYEDGCQLRDFVYVKDLLSVVSFLMEQRPESGIYNLGTGKARTFNDLTNAVFRAMKEEPRIVYIDTPEDIREKYQYFTEATMDKLRKAGYNQAFTSLEDGVEDYVKNYLINEVYF